MSNLGRKRKRNLLKVKSPFVINGSSLLLYNTSVLLASCVMQPVSQPCMADVSASKLTLLNKMNNVEERFSTGLVNRCSSISNP